MRLNGFIPNIFYHEVQVPTYPLFDYPPYETALSSTMVDVIIPLSKTGIALGSILVFTQVMGDFFVVKAMSGGQSASIVSALYNEIQAMEYPPAEASAVVLVICVAIGVACMMRVVDVRKELVK